MIPDLRTEVGRRGALGRLEHRADRAQGRGRGGHRVDRDPDRGGALGDRPRRLVIALFSVRKADEPADADHPYGHEKVENLASAIEGTLILLGALVIVFEATRRLVNGAEVESLGVGIAVVAFSAVVNLGVSTYLYRRARALDSPALGADAAHLRSDSLTSLGVLVGLVLIQLTGVEAFDSIVALVVAMAIVVSGVRILTRSGRELVDEAPPPAELDRIEAAIAAARAARGRRLSTSCAPAAPAAAGTSTSTSSFAPAPRSSAPTRWRTRCAGRSRPRSRGPTS